MTCTCTEYKSTCPVHCSCQSIGAPNVARQCPQHFSLWRGDKRLVSVSKIVGMWPQDPCSTCHWPIYSDHAPGCIVKRNIDNANRRGREVDSLFSAWVVGKLDRIPAGVGKDSRELFVKLTKWFDKQNFSSVESQVLVADEEVGGVLDLRLDGMIVDLKCTYDVSESYPIQVGGYLALDNATAVAAKEKRAASRGAILHCTERLSEPKFISLDTVRVISDFMTCREMWKLVDRVKNGGKVRAAKPEPKPAAVEPKSDTIAKLLRNIQLSQTIEGLTLYGEQAKTAPDTDRPALREAFKKRYMELLSPSVPPPTGYDRGKTLSSAPSPSVAQSAAVSASADAGRGGGSLFGEGESPKPAQTAASEEVWI